MNKTYKDGWYATHNIFCDDGFVEGVMLRGSYLWTKQEWENGINGKFKYNLSDSRSYHDLEEDEFSLSKILSDSEFYGSDEYFYDPED